MKEKQYKLIIFGFIIIILTIIVFKYYTCLTNLAKQNTLSTLETIELNLIALDNVLNSEEHTDFKKNTITTLGDNIFLSILNYHNFNIINPISNTTNSANLLHFGSFISSLGEEYEKSNFQEVKNYYNQLSNLFKQYFNSNEYKLFIENTNNFKITSEYKNLLNNIHLISEEAVDFIK